MGRRRVGWWKHRERKLTKSDWQIPANLNINNNNDDYNYHHFHRASSSSLANENFGPFGEPQKICRCFLKLVRLKESIVAQRPHALPVKAHKFTVETSRLSGLARARVGCPFFADKRDSSPCKQHTHNSHTHRPRRANGGQKHIVKANQTPANEKVHTFSSWKSQHFLPKY